MQQYPYLLGILIILVVWLILFFLRKDLRKEMLMMGLFLFLLASEAEKTYFQDYWKPEVLFKFHLFGFPITIEDLLFGFLLGGISGVLYEVLFRKKFLKIKRERKGHRQMWLFFVILGWCALHYLVNLNSIFEAMTLYIFGASIIIIFRRDLVLDALFSGIFLGLLAFIGYFLYIPLFPGVLQKNWFLYGTPSGIQIAGVPLTEILWFFTLGMVVGPLYEFWQGYRLKSKK